MVDQNKLSPPTATIGDHAHTIARATISLIPSFGGPAVELFNSLIVPPILKRRQEWEEEVVDCLLKLDDQQKIIFTRLESNQAFQDTYIRAFQLALNNSQKEKRDSLKNAVLNSALPNPPEESRQQMFLGLIDLFTKWHLIILRFFADPQAAFREQGIEIPPNELPSSISQALVKMYPVLKNDRSFYEKIGRDLHFHGLTSIETFHAVSTTSGALAKRSTDFGDEFLKFISEP